MATVDELIRQKVDAFDVSSLPSPSPKRPATEATRRIGVPSSMLRTPQGLNVAVKQAGLESKAKQILAKKGEDPNKIFSGGFITDTFDTLNALQYGIVGVAKGKLRTPSYAHQQFRRLRDNFNFFKPQELKKK